MGLPAQSDPINETDVFGVRIHAQRFSEAVDQVTAWANEAAPRFICLCPVSTIIQCRDDDTLHQQLHTAAMRTADGMPIVWMQHMMGHHHAERVYGPDLLIAVCSQHSAVPLRHYFLGGAAGVAERLVESLQDRFPRIEVVGIAAPIVQPRTTMPDLDTIARIRAAQPDIVWVGLGSPKQERWMALHSPMLPFLLIGVGAAFDFLSGAKRQAPVWMQERGLEWLFRFIQEPRRLARRYIIYNTRFIVLVIVGWFTGQFRSQGDEMR